MSKRKEGIISTIAFKNGQVKLSIQENGQWSDDGLSIILAEMKSFVSSIISGEIYEDYPEAKGTKPAIEIISGNIPSKKAEPILASLKKRSSFDFDFVFVGSD